MAQLPTPFNAFLFDPAAPSQQLPISDANGHPVIITESEFKATKGNANNGYLELTLSVIDGPHKGASGSYRLNLFHENAQTVEIANRQLSAICHVVNQHLISDSSQLHNIPFRAIVGFQKKQKPEDPDYTHVTGVLDINGNKPKAQAGNSPQAAPVQSAPAFAQAPAPQQAPAFAQPQGTPAFAQAPAAPANPSVPAWAR